MSVCSRGSKTMLLLLLLFAVGSSTFSYEVSEGCVSSQSCMIVTECPAAKESLTLTRRHNLKRCGWAGYFELVCCPPAQVESKSSKNNIGIRKSEQACNGFAKEVPQVPMIRHHIMGGENAEAGEFPHMVALGYDSAAGNNMNWQCGGSLISNKYVLTAAHCIVMQNEIPPRIARLGKIDILGTSDNLKAQDYKIEKIIVHPKYDIRNKFNDIALLRLEGTVLMNNNVRPACLYDKGDAPKDLEITGYGMINGNSPNSDVLQKAEVTPTDLQDCNRTYTSTLFPRAILDTQICAISRDATRWQDTCKGDSGGPLQFRDLRERSLYSVVGITSFGDECGGGRMIPSVYTRVSSYLDWIEPIVWPDAL